MATKVDQGVKMKWAFKDCFSAAAAAKPAAYLLVTHLIDPNINFILVSSL